MRFSPSAILGGAAAVLLTACPNPPEPETLRIVGAGPGGGVAVASLCNDENSDIPEGGTLSCDEPNNQANSAATVLRNEVALPEEFGTPEFDEDGNPEIDEVTGEQVVSTRVIAEMLVHAEPDQQGRIDLIAKVAPDHLLDGRFVGVPTRGHANDQPVDCDVFGGTITDLRGNDIGSANLSDPETPQVRISQTFPLARMSSVDYHDAGGEEAGGFMEAASQDGPDVDSIVIFDAEELVATEGMNGLLVRCDVDRGGSPRGAISQNRLDQGVDCRVRFEATEDTVPVGAWALNSGVFVTQTDGMPGYDPNGPLGDIEFEVEGDTAVMLGSVSPDDPTTRITAEGADCDEVVVELQAATSVAHPISQGVQSATLAGSNVPGTTELTVLFDGFSGEVLVNQDTPLSGQVVVVRGDF